MPAFLFILIIVVFLLASGYIASKICRVLKRRPTWVRLSVWGIVLLLDFGFFLTKIFDFLPIAVLRPLYIVSTMWLVVVLYGFISFLTLDIVQLVAMNAGASRLYHSPRQVAIATFITTILLIYGVFNAKSPDVVEYNVSTNKMPVGNDIRVALVSDLHMGYAVTDADIVKLVNLTNALNPDVICIAGDLIDGDLKPVITEDIGRNLEKFSAPLGVYAIMGNHEYLDDNIRAEQYIRTLKGVNLLRDSVAFAGSNIAIVGRDDISYRRAYSAERKTLKELLSSHSDDMLTIVLDHQPIAFREAEEQGVDFNLSGHTHAGQVWPMRFFTSRLFELDYGCASTGNTTAVVTSGFGTWGPRVRIGSQAEVVLLNIKGTHK